MNCVSDVEAEDSHISHLPDATGPNRGDFIH